MSIKVVSWDAEGPETDNNVAYVEIDDPRNPKCGHLYSVGFQLVGEDPRDTKSWKYHHAAYFPAGDNSEPKGVDISELEPLLAEQGSSKEALLLQYIGLVKWQKLGLSLRLSLRMRSPNDFFVFC
jgi:hypothetical protein